MNKPMTDKELKAAIKAENDMYGWLVTKLSQVQSEAAQNMLCSKIDETIEKIDRLKRTLAVREESRSIKREVA